MNLRFREDIFIEDIFMEDIFAEDNFMEDIFIEVVTKTMKATVKVEFGKEDKKSLEEWRGTRRNLRKPLISGS